MPGPPTQSTPPGGSEPGGDDTTTTTLVALDESFGTGPTELDARRELAEDFQLEGLLARTATAAAYVARDKAGRRVMLKVAARAVVPDPGGGEQFQRTAEAAGQLDHPHILPFYGWGATANFFWYALRHVDGRSLADLLHTDGPMAPTACQPVFTQVASALDYLHRQGVPHGALIPASVIVDTNGVVLVADVAVAAFLAGQAASAEADQRALAALVYECLCGTPPPASAAPPLGDLRPDIPVPLAEAVRRALSPRPEEQFPTVLDFLAATRDARPLLRPAWLTRPPARRTSNPPVIIDFDQEPRGLGRQFAAAAALVAAAGAVWFGMSAAPAERVGIARAPDRSPPVLPAALAPAAPAVPSAPPAASAPAVVPRTVAPPVPAPARARPHHAPPRRPLARPLEPGRLSINALPWGVVAVDGRVVGNTPVVDLVLAAGTHRIRVAREGFQAVERVVQVNPGQALRITDIVLRELLP